MLSFSVLDQVPAQESGIGFIQLEWIPHESNFGLFHSDVLLLPWLHMGVLVLALLTLLLLQQEDSL